MDKFQQEIYKTIDIIIENKLKDLQFDRSKRGKVISIGGTTCVVSIDGEEFTCKVRRGLNINVGNVVYISYPSNNESDKYVDSILGDNSTTTTIGLINNTSYIHNQIAPSLSWNISHNLSSFPTATIVDSGGSVVIGDIQYVDENNIIVMFTTEFSGKAYLNVGVTS